MPPNPTPTAISILLVEDEKIHRVTLRDDLQEAGYPVREAASAEEGLRQLQTGAYPIVVTDLKMPGMDGLEFLRRIKTLHPDAFVVVMTAFGTVETAVAAIREGAYDYLTKPFSGQELVIVIKRIEELCRLRDENVALRKRLQEKTEQAALVGQSPIIQRLREHIQMLAQTDSPVLITGETGTGKDMVARLIHNQGPRHKEPFIKVSCAMYPVNVLESELFGHEKGAFTGATQSRKGRFEAAGKGTVYLDEVDDIPLPVQVKLLHVLEDGVIEKVGGTDRIPFHARIVVASKQDLENLVAAEKFRQDLFFRMNVISLALPPLRTYTEDLPYLIAHFLHTFGQPAEVLRFSEEALQRLAGYIWPGNVRELRNLVERLLFLAPSQTISASDLAPLLGGEEQPSVRDAGKSLDAMVNAYEKEIIRKTLRECADNKSRAAQKLNIKLSTFRDRLKKHDLD